jgi:hypothetical protein
VLAARGISIAAADPMGTTGIPGVWVAGNATNWLIKW